MQKSYAILDAMEINMVAKEKKGRSGGSKYLPDELKSTLLEMQPKQAIIVPFMDMGDVKDPQERQRYGHEWWIKEWTKKEIAKPAEKDGEGNVTKAAIPAPKFVVGLVLPAKDAEGKVIRDGGIGIRRES